MTKLKYSLATLVLVLSLVNGIQVTINSPLNSTYNAEPTFQATASEDVEWKVNLNDAGYSSIGSGSNILASLSVIEGSNKLEVNASNNESQEVQTIFFTVDLTHPSTPALTGEQSSGQVTLTWTASIDAISQVSHYKIYRNSTNIANTSNLNYNEALQTGTFQYTVTAVDYAGLESMQSNAFNANNTASISINQQPSYTYAARNYTFQVSTSPNSTNATLVLNAQTHDMSYANGSYWLTLSNLKANMYEYKAIVTYASNVFSETENHQFIISKAEVPLSLSVNNLTSNLTINKGEKAEVKVTSQTTYPLQFKLAITGKLDQNITSPFITNLDIQTVQTTTITVTFTGDENYTPATQSANVQVKTDDSPPVFMEFIPPKVTSKSATLKLETNEDSNLRIDYGANTEMQQLYIISEYSTTHTITLEKLEPNTLYYFKITSCDKANNCDSIERKIFTTAPAEVTTTTIQTTTNSTPSTATSVTEKEKQELQETPAAQTSNTSEKTHYVDYITSKGEVLSIKAVQKISVKNGQTNVEIQIETPTDLNNLNLKVTTSKPATQISQNGQYKEGKITWSKLDFKAKEKTTLAYTITEQVNNPQQIIEDAQITIYANNASSLTGFAIKAEHLTLSGAAVLLLAGIIALVKMKKNKLPLQKSPAASVKTSNSFKNIKKQVLEH